MKNILKTLICISFWFRPPGLSKMKELNQNSIGKGLFAALKGHLCLKKEHLDNPEGPVEVESPKSEYVSDTSYSNWQRSCF